MTNQVNQAFEDFYNENKHLYTDTSPYGIMLTTFQAATQASEQRITELQELLNDRQSDLDFEFNRAEQNELDCNALKERVEELQASNNQLREELETTLTSLQERYT